jgi:hypothetical protein
MLRREDFRVGDTVGFEGTICCSMIVRFQRGKHPF